MPATMIVITIDCFNQIVNTNQRYYFSLKFYSVLGFLRLFLKAVTASSGGKLTRLSLRVFRS